jgi:hypothetical protein
MGNLGPLYLAWSRLRNRPIHSVNLLAVLMVCHVLLLTQLGFNRASQPSAVDPRPVRQVPSDGSLTQEEKEPGEVRKPTARDAVAMLGVVLAVTVVISFSVNTGVADYLDESATLRALGYPLSYLTRVDMAYSLLLVVSGFVLAVLVLAGICALGGLSVWFEIGSLQVVGMDLLFTMATASVAGLLGARKLHAADPADLF